MGLNPKTVVIKHPDYIDGILINADDFDPEIHVLVGDVEEGLTPKEVEEVKEAE